MPSFSTFMVNRLTQIWDAVKLKCGGNCWNQNHVLPTTLIVIHRWVNLISFGTKYKNNRIINSIWDYAMAILAKFIVDISTQCQLVATQSLVKPKLNKDIDRDAGLGSRNFMPNHGGKPGCLGKIFQIISQSFRQLQEIFAIDQNHFQNHNYFDNFNFVPDPMFLMSKSGRFIDANNSFCELTGYEYEDLIGRDDLDLNIWVDLEAREEINTRLQAIGVVRNQEINYRKKSGVVGTALVSAQRIPWDGSWCILVVAKDISDRIAAMDHCQRAEAEIQMLLTIHQAINEAKDFHQALAVVLRSVCETTGWHYGEAWVPSSDGTALECSPSWYCQRSSVAPEVMKAIASFRTYSEALVFLPDEELPGRVWKRGQPQWVLDFSTDIEDSDVFLRADMAKRCGMNGAFGVPIFARPSHTNIDYQSYQTSNSPVKLLAVLVFFMLESRPEDEEYVNLVSTVTGEIGTVMQQKQGSAELRALFAAMTDIIVALDNQGCYVKIAPTNPAKIYKPVPNLIGKSLHEVFERQQADIFLKHLRQAISTQKPVHFDYRLTVKGEEFWFASSMAPISEESALWVSRDVSDKARAQAALKKANQELERLANLDGLTEVANRRRFDEYLSRNWQKMEQKKLFLSLILCDVDYFKCYNDKYGHQAGDDCLKQIAKAITKAVSARESLVARYGGEEFAVVLPAKDMAGALKVAAAIRREVALLNMVHEDSQVSPYVTLSMGVASIVPDDTFSAQQLLLQADNALYKAKQQGRNRVCK
ncbi:diguanylate cyclase domain-containing protein [[Phormidium] sp. ETS-05]|uniref:diguanylate cyclase domain-containing protein n=1 Tax=[Phormidium] sp. ETS-05 TaxID=222819 RepID=UPI0018EF1C73|nr:diguanylate cyclase [[Phormidium] sp. ETS-05]